jgi:ribA/ribD-fused uncharacterized protein
MSIETIHPFYKSTLSQWHKCSFIDENTVRYNCAEQYMMYQKALLFDDLETAEQIINEESPKVQQEFGRKVKNYNQKIWDENKYRIVLAGNLLRFPQNKYLTETLNATGKKLLVEASPIEFGVLVLRSII